MRELIKELKRDIISGFTYRALELEEGVSIETLIYEQGKVLYSYNDTRKEGAAIIFSSKEEFLKCPLEEVERSINEAYYYNVRERSEQEVE